MNFKLLHIFLFLVMASLCKLSFADEKSQAINYEKHFVKSLVGAKEQEIILKINGESINKPFKWSVTIKDETGTLFYTEHDDAWLDKFFGDDGYMIGCIGYLECKEKWYFKDIEMAVNNSIKQINYPENGPVYQPWRSGTLETIAKSYLREKSFSESQIQKIINEMAAELQTSYVSLNLPFTPVQGDAVYMFVPSLGYYVPYYDD